MIIYHEKFRLFFCKASGSGPNEKMAQIDILGIAKDSLDDNSDTRLLFSCVVYAQWLKIIKIVSFYNTYFILKLRQKNG